MDIDSYWDILTNEIPEETLLSNLINIKLESSLKVLSTVLILHNLICHQTPWNTNVSFGSPFFRIPTITMFRQMNAYNTCRCSHFAVMTIRYQKRGNKLYEILELLPLCLIYTSLLHFFTQSNWVPISGIQGPYSWMRGTGIKHHIFHWNFLLGSYLKAWRSLKVVCARVSKVSL